MEDNEEDKHGLVVFLVIQCTEYVVPRGGCGSLNNYISILIITNCSCFVFAYALHASSPIIIISMF